MYIISYQNATSWWNIMKLKLKYQTLTNWHDLRNTNIQYVLCYFQTDKQYQCAWFDVIQLSLAIKSACWGKNSIRIPNRQKGFVKIYFYSWVEVVHSQALTTQSRRNPYGKKVFALINKGCHAWNERKHGDEAKQIHCNILQWPTCNIQKSSHTLYLVA